MRHCGLTPMREPLQGRCIGDGYGDDEVSCANALLLALSRGVAAKACRKAPRALTSPRSLSLAGRTQIGAAPGGGSVTLLVFREPIVRRLTAGGEWIRTFSSALGRQRVRRFVRVGADLLAHRSSEQLPAPAHRSSCRAADGGAVTHRPDQAASHHRRAVDGASSSRNQRFESVSLQRRVCEPSPQSADGRSGSADFGSSGRTLCRPGGNLDA